MVGQCDDSGGMDQGGPQTSSTLCPGLVPAQRCQPAHVGEEPDPDGGGERFLVLEGGSGIEGPMMAC